MMVLTRRRLLITTTGLPLALWLRGVTGSVVQQLVDGRELSESGINIDMPRIAETGNSVPITVSVDSPMTESDYVKMIHIIVPGNPEKKAVTWHLTPMSGKAEISTRIRLAKTQTVRAIAELSDNSVRGAGVNIVVTVGACVEDIWTD
ncbi:MAG: thiosulfate oxidation carrier protein SoxY [Pseudomonadales bacterium]